ncbi:hypothetical protein LTR53_007689 [Teratosphaeriaceae sp. CCFEE 6253]|nr:hypothetical protein LTR53_007689 [Teratosphaeriaceae sp. CCFEE 6253]
MAASKPELDEGALSAADIETQAYVVDHVAAPFTLRDILLDARPRAHEVLVEWKFSGICHTDLIVRDGMFPILAFPAILGHEGAGYIRALGAGVQHARPELGIGDFVLATFNSCGACKQCKRSHPAFCHRGGVLHMGATRPEDGSSPARLKDDGRSVRSQFYGQSTFAKMSMVQASAVAMKYPYDPAEAWKFAACGCGFQTGAGTVLNVLRPQRDDVVVVVGLGGVGLTAVMAAKFLGVETVVAVDIDAGRLELARELGATSVVDSRATPDLVAEVMRITGGEGADSSIDCVGQDSYFGARGSRLRMFAGNHTILEDLVKCLAKCGTVASVGVMAPGKSVVLDPRAHLGNNKRYIGVLEGDSNPPEASRDHEVFPKAADPLTCRL